MVLTDSQHIQMSKYLFRVLFTLTIHLLLGPLYLGPSCYFHNFYSFCRNIISLVSYPKPEFFLELDGRKNSNEFLFDQILYLLT